MSTVHINDLPIRFDYHKGFEDAATILTSLSTHSDSGVRDFPSTFKDTNELSLAQQYDVLSGVSNYAWRECLNFNNKVTKATGRNSHVTMHRAFGEPCKKRYPASVRNKFIYFWVKGNFEYCDRLLRHYYDGEVVVLDIDMRDVNDTGINENYEMHGDVDRPSQKKQQPQHSHPFRLGESMYNNMCLKETTYEAFKSQITSKVFRWRRHSNNDIFCLNDYDSDTGILLSNQFVHVERYVQLNDVISYRCSCKAYKTAIAQSSHEPDNNYSCSHCLYMISHIEPQLAIFPDILQTEAVDTDTCVQQLIKKSAESINKKVLYLPATSKGSNKIYFSVLCANSYSFCHISGDFVLCGKTSCKQDNLNKRKVTTLLRDGATACEHLLCLKEHYDDWSIFVDDENSKEIKEHAKVYYKCSILFT